MTHEDAGHYANKHQGKTIDTRIASDINHHVKNSTITCAALHAVAKKLGISPTETGVQADLMELRLVGCSLGLFGYGDPENKVSPMDTVPQTLDKELDSESADGRISCLACWTIAEKMNLKRKAVAAACETKGLKIKPCQLGAF